MILLYCCCGVVVVLLCCGLNWAKVGTRWPPYVTVSVSPPSVIPFSSAYCSLMYRHSFSNIIACYGVNPERLVCDIVSRSRRLHDNLLINRRFERDDMTSRLRHQVPVTFCMRTHLNVSVLVLRSLPTRLACTSDHYMLSASAVISVSKLATRSVYSSIYRAWLGYEIYQLSSCKTRFLIFESSVMIGLNQEIAAV